ncbi:Undecaprenyl-diphosphatase [Variovorax sp. OK605]|uniref:phosphatase PAP2 family protein n=1 Tax=Variovorax sp. OK605 TaxID=1855317 RepID=UPI0008E9E8F8|nr:phosphatase PAP2 family protein [Variovorax sp. OK605]SFP90159.1 Undecaprenyl-diphosphatase [Variovorax sp. OK605]
MTFDNIHLFELINAGAQPGWTTLALARAVAQWLVLAVPVAWLALWARGARAVRHDLVHVAVSAALALGLAQLVGLAWPSPRPFAVHLGHQYLAHVGDPGLPSDHVTLLWSLAFAVLGTARGSWLVFPLLAAGLLVGWARVYLGVHFPLDVAAALPVAAVGAGLALALRPALETWSRPLWSRYDACERAALRFLHLD